MKRRDIKGPGKLILPPEIKSQINSEKNDQGFINYEEYSYLDIIKDVGETNEPTEGLPVIILYGDTSEMHRWGVNLRENDFFRQVNTLKKIIKEKREYRLIVGVRRTNFFHLKEIFKFILEIRKEKIGFFPDFSIKPLGNISKRFNKYLGAIKKIGLGRNVEFKVVDSQFKNFLVEIERDVKKIEANILSVIGEITETNILKKSDFTPFRDDLEIFEELRTFMRFKNSGISKIKQTNQNMVFYGHTAESHAIIGSRQQFFKNVRLIKKNFNNTYKIVIGVSRNNFLNIQKILDFISWHNLNLHQKIIKLLDPIYKGLSKTPVSFPRLTLETLKNIRKIFDRYLSTLNKNSPVEFEIIDCKLNGFLGEIEKTAQRIENNFLRAMGPVCKEVFTGPRMVLFNLNGTCNTDCVYCRKFSPFKGKHVWNNTSNSSLDLITVENVLNDVKDMGIEKILLVGEGEPTLYPHFKEVMKKIRENGLSFNMSTNGSMIHKYLDELSDGTCDTLTVSMSWATKKSFSKIRPGTSIKHMEIIERNVKNLSDLKNKDGSPGIVLLHAINAYNYYDIIEMANQAVRLGADSIWFQLTHLEDFSRKQLSLNKKQMNQIRKDLLEAKKICEKGGVNFDKFIDYELEHYHDERGDWSVNALLEEGCYVGWHFAYIDLNDRLSFCCGPRRIWILEKNRGFRQGWYSNTYRRYRNDGIIMHKENPIDLFGNPLYGPFCQSCDNHDQNNYMIGLIKEYNLQKFVER